MHTSNNCHPYLRLKDVSEEDEADDNIIIEGESRTNETEGNAVPYKNLCRINDAIKEDAMH